MRPRSGFSASSPLRLPPRDSAPMIPSAGQVSATCDLLLRWDCERVYDAIQYELRPFGLTPCVDLRELVGVSSTATRSV